LFPSTSHHEHARDAAKKFTFRDVRRASPKANLLPGKYLATSAADARSENRSETDQKPT
jgi:hypothetical protein